MIWGAIIVAAGRGTRFGTPKQLLEVAGKSLVAWSIEALAQMPEILDLVIVTEAEFAAEMESQARARCGEMTLSIVGGGATRQDSVRLGLAALAARCTGVLVHDGARPAILTSDIRAAMRVVRPGTASLLATPVVDTIKVSDATGKVVRTLDRGTLWAAQTPQCATVDDLQRAHRDAHLHNVSATDDATLLERAGLDVVIVPAHADNFKVTFPSDLARAETILSQRSPMREGEEEVLLVEAFVGEAAVDAICRELEERDGRLDGIDRDFPSSIAIRAFVPSPMLRGFGERFAFIAGTQAIYTTHFSHFGPRTSDERRAFRAAQTSG